MVLIWLNGRKIKVWSASKFSYEMHTAASTALSIPSSVQSKMAKNALIYRLTADPTEREGAKK